MFLPDQPADPAGQQTPAVAAPDPVADGVAEDRPGDRRDQYRSEADPVLEGEHPAEQDRDLAGKHEPDERRGLQQRYGEHDDQRRPAGQAEDVPRDVVHHRGLATMDGRARYPALAARRDRCPWMAG